ncbi:MAG: GTP cyclohydrolase, FolE2/MptA family [Thermodesulfobacteriota bacterium]|nr:GTP cyclohydrolase, FolE2/MptA family [Thermodesulfobacteriota bacterium]
MKNRNKTNLIPEEIHRQVIRLGTDVPEQPPSFALSLGEVGIANKTVWVRLPEGRIPFIAKVTVSLPAELRGIHMSRIERVIAELDEQEFVDLRAYGMELGRRVLDSQRGAQGLVHLSGKLPHVRRSKISGYSSMDSIDISADIRLEEAEQAVTAKVMLGVGVCHITACPCTQLYNRDVFQADEHPCPLPTHSQRSLTSLQIEGGEEKPGFFDLLNCLESALHVTQDLLKRPDEAEIVLQSHQSPQFAEDAVRETARAAADYFDLLPDATRIIIESLSLESIHIHDVCCRLETNLAEIRRCVNQTERRDDSKS